MVEHRASTEVWPSGDGASTEVWPSGDEFDPYFADPQNSHILSRVGLKY